MKKYDSIIIGSGQAGTPLAFNLAAQGDKVAFIEKDQFGGTCLNTGCTPTKAYVASARRIFDANNGQHLGINIPAGAKAVLPEIKQRKDELIKSSVDWLRNSLQENKNIDIYKGHASFTGVKRVTVNQSEFEGDKIFINVGARARIPDGFDQVNYLTNKEILELEEIPEHLLIVGGSYIGLEFGQIFRRFGSQVTIIEQGQRLISREDENTSNTIKNILEKEGVNFKMNAQCLEGKKNEDGNISIKISCDDQKSTITGSHLLLAVGRIPNTDDLNLKAAGIKIDNKGYIKTDDQLQANISGIYALGDCNGKGAFTHTSYNDYEIVSDNLFNKKTRKVSDRIMTYALFTDPPLGRAGMTLIEARSRGKKLKVANRKMADVARAREKGETQGFMNCIIDAETDKIIGASVLGVGGDEIISSILNVMYADQPYTVIRDSVQIHPTVSELIPTMLETLEIIE